MRDRVASRAEAAERLKTLDKILQADLERAQPGNHEAAAELRQYLELLPVLDDLLDDPLAAQYQTDLQGRLSLGSTKDGKKRAFQPNLLADHHLDVERFKRYFAGSGRAWLHLGVRRLGWYGEMIRQTLLAEGLPKELVYLPIIESLYDPQA
ncbi:MAG TPA: hypothetical protein VGL91_22855, partial [Acidobacteriota bacterium]